MQFSGKNVLITGAGEGIGAEIARVLAKFDLKVWINHRFKPEPADALKEEVEREDGVAALIRFDASKEEGSTNTVKLVVGSGGELSYLANNAGITNDKLALRMNLENLNFVADTNLNSAFLGCKEALKVISKKHFGAVINIASIVGEMGNMGQVNYSASEGGMIAMTKSFAKKGASKNLRSNCVMPGFILSDMTENLNEEVKKNYEESIPLKRFAKSCEVANCVAFLLSDYASYVAGDVLKINDGLCMQGIRYYF